MAPQDQPFGQGFHAQQEPDTSIGFSQGNALEDRNDGFDLEYSFPQISIQGDVGDVEDANIDVGGSSMNPEIDITSTDWENNMTSHDESLQTDVEPGHEYVSYPNDNNGSHLTDVTPRDVPTSVYLSASSNFSSFQVVGMPEVLPDPNFLNPAGGEYYGRHGSPHRAENLLSLSSGAFALPRGTPAQAKRLAPKFQRPHHARSYFKLGVVFRVHWAELAGDIHPGISVVTTELGENVFCKIRWMVVIREGNDCCTCLPIQTHRGKGATNKMKCHYAPMFTGNEAPETLLSEQPCHGEAPMGKPILVIPAKRWDKLDPMSRVNVDKVYTVEHNIKVYHFGKVDRNSLDDLINHFTSQFVIPRNLSPPPTTSSWHADGHTQRPRHRRAYLDHTSVAGNSRHPSAIDTRGGFIQPRYHNSLTYFRAASTTADLPSCFPSTESTPSTSNYTGMNHPFPQLYETGTHPPAVYRSLGYQGYLPYAGQHQSQGSNYGQPPENINQSNTQLDRFHLCQSCGRNRL